MSEVSLHRLAAMLLRRLHILPGGTYAPALPACTQEKQNHGVREGVRGSTSGDVEACASNAASPRQLPARGVLVFKAHRLCITQLQARE